MPLDPKHSEASFSPNLTDLPCLRVAKVCLDVEIWLFFCWQRQNQLVYPCACARSNNRMAAELAESRISTTIPRLIFAHICPPFLLVCIGSQPPVWYKAINVYLTTFQAIWINTYQFWLFNNVWSLLRIILSSAAPGYSDHTMIEFIV